MARLPVEQMAFGPAKVAEKLGILNTAIVTGIGAVALWIVFKAEP
jgi:hypothetical protein